MKKAVKLAKQAAISLVPKAPFNFDATFFKPAHFATGDNFWQPRTRWQTFWWQNKHLGVKFESQGGFDKPKIQVKIYFRKKLTKEFVDSLIKEIRYRYNLDLNLIPFYQKFQKDKLLGPAIKRLHGMRPGHQNSLYEFAISSVLKEDIIEIRMYWHLINR